MDLDSSFVSLNFSQYTDKDAERVNEDGQTILHIQSSAGNEEGVVFILSKFANSNLLVKLDSNKDSALHLAAKYGHYGVVKVLIDAARRLPCSDPLICSFQAFIRHSNANMATALHLAVESRNEATARLLVEADPKHFHTENNYGETPIYLAARLGCLDMVWMICIDCKVSLSLNGPRGSTVLHALIENLNSGQEKNLTDFVCRFHFFDDNKSWKELFNKTDENNVTPLHLAVSRNYVHLVRLFLEVDPAYQDGRGRNNSHLKAVIDIAAENGYNHMVKLLCQTHKGLPALLFAIRSRDKEFVLSLLEEDKHIVTMADDIGWTPLHHAVSVEFDSIIDAIVEAQEYVKEEYIKYDSGYTRETDAQPAVFINRYSLSMPIHLALEQGQTFPRYGYMVPTPLSLAMEQGQTSTVKLLLKLLPASSYVVRDMYNRNILHSAAFKENKEMIQYILQYCPAKYTYEILNQKDYNGDTPLHLLVRVGCFVPELIKHKRVDRMAKNNQNWTPSDELYIQDQIIADQVRIKETLDNSQTNQHWKFWRTSIKETSNTQESVVPQSRRSRKDSEFKKAKKLLISEERKRMKEELDRYRRRTNTQIIVTALITTVTFTVGFTMPGGYHQSGEPDQGLAVLSKNTAFNAFMVSDALALALSTTSLFIYFISSMYEDPDQVSKLDAASTVLNIVSVMAMMLTFITGTYVVLSHSPALAITISVICSIFFLCIIVLLIKMIYDRNKVDKLKV